VQFNFTRTTIISGRVHNDTAADGTSGSADPGAAGITIYLDDNGNGQLDAGETTAVTQIDGTYELYPVMPTAGTYTSTIRQQPPAGWLVVSANDDNTKSSLPVTITTANPESLGNNFLDVQLVTLGGTVFNDANGNGVRDPGEAGLPNITVNVTGPGGTTPVTTGADGSWAFQSKVRGTYTSSVVTPTGTVVTAPNRASPLFGTRDANGDFASVPPDSDVPLANSTAVASLWNAATGSHDTYAGVTWVNSDGDVGVVSVVRLDDGSSTGAVVWSVPVTETQYVNQIVTNSSPGTPGLVFATVNGWASKAVTDTQLVRINPDGSTSAVAVNSGELFAAWPHLSGTGGLVSVDPSGKVWSWSGASGSTRFAMGQVTGTPIDIVAFQPGSSNGAATPESIAILVKVDGQMAVQIIDPTGNLSAPITLGGVDGLSLAAGDFNADGIDDLAVLTNPGCPATPCRPPNRPARIRPAR